MDAVDENEDGIGDNLIRLTNHPAIDAGPAWGPGASDEDEDDEDEDEDED